MRHWFEHIGERPAQFPPAGDHADLRDEPLLGAYLKEQVAKAEAGSGKRAGVMASFIPRSPWESRRRKHTMPVAACCANVCSAVFCNTVLFVYNHGNA